MILVDGDKYACVQCIRGHRSSTCKHSARPLVQVRGRGRPSLNAGHRIAVTESEVVLSRDEVTIQDSINDGNYTKQKQKQNQIKSASKNVETIASVKPTKEQSSSSKSCCTKKIPTTPVAQPPKSCCGSSKQSSSIIHPAPKPPSPKNDPPSCCSTTHSECGCGKNGVIMLRASKRQFVDVKNGNIDYVGPYNDALLNKFKLTKINPSKRIKHTKGSSCSSRSNTNNKLKLLKQIKMNEFDYKMTTNPYKNQLDPALSASYVSNNHLALGFPLSLPSLSPCTSQPEIQSKQSQPQHRGFDQAFQEYQSQTSESHTSSVPPPMEPLQPQPQEKIYDVVYSSGCADECNCGPDCNCPGCLIHRTNEELKEYGILDTSTSSTPSEATRQSPSNYDLINLETIDEMLLRDMFEEECFCNADDCCCYNCSKHGISEGIRLRDGIRVSGSDGGLNFAEESIQNLEQVSNVENSGSCCAGKSIDTFGVLASPTPTSTGISGGNSVL